MKMEEEIRQEAEQINRLAELEIETLLETSQSGLSSVRTDVAERADIPTDPFSLENLRDMYYGEEPKSFREIYGDNPYARRVYLQGLMHGRLLALEWVLEQRHELYPPV